MCTLFEFMLEKNLKTVNVSLLTYNIIFFFVEKFEWKT